MLAAAAAFRGEHNIKIEPEARLRRETQRD
jgi:hypothetical protein